MCEHPVTSYLLANGLEVICCDHSTKMAADRWKISIVVKIDIPVERRWFTGQPIDEEAFSKVRQRLGDGVVFQQTYERYFVSDDDKQETIHGICERALAMAKAYMSRDSFPVKLILKRFAESSRTG